MLCLRPEIKLNVTNTRRLTVKERKTYGNPLNARSRFSAPIKLAAAKKGPRNHIRRA
jgi:hypothetical protein